MPPLKSSDGEYLEGAGNSSNFLGHVNPTFEGAPEDGCEPDTVTGSRSAPPPDGVNTLAHQEATVKDVAIPRKDKLPSKHVSVRASDIDDRTEQPNTTNSEPCIRTQLLGALMAAMTQLSLGTIVGLPGVTLPQLTDPHSSDLYLDTNQVALFGSLIHIGAIVGSIAGGMMNLYVGQRVTLLLAMPFSLALWLAMSFTSTVWLLLLVRTLLGLTQGLVGAASGNYVIELSSSKLRGRLTGFIETGRQVGFLMVYLVGSLDLTWREVMLVCGCITAIPPFVGLLFLPDSPRWLVTRGRFDEARKSLLFFRGSHYDIQPEFDSITDQIKRTSANKKSLKDQLRQMREPSVLRRMLLLAFLMIAIQFTGNMSIATYVVPIFQATDSGINSYVSAALVGSIRVVGTIVFLLVVDRVGRRSMIFVTTLTCATTMLSLGVYFFLHHRGVDVGDISWLPLSTIMVFTAFVCGAQAVMSLLRSELLPTSVRATTTAIMYVFFFTGMFIATQTFPLIVEGAGEHGAFWIYSGSCVLIALVVGFKLPETQGLSLEQIDDLFRYGESTVQAINPRVSAEKVP